MDITAAIKKMKKEPGFRENVGMILCHNGVVRGWSRVDKSTVAKIEVTPDRATMERLRSEYEAKPGIYKILVEAKEGTLEPGDDLLFIVVAGDIRENVKPVLAELLDRIKSEAVSKREITRDDQN
jgi:molybdopterin synthase catalytic subunit